MEGTVTQNNIEWNWDALSLYSKILITEAVVPSVNQTYWCLQVWNKLS